MTQEFQFDFTGGNLVLDFSNTSASRKDEGTQVERLHSYSDLLSFAAQAKLVTAGQARELSALADAHPSRARRAFQQGLELREALYGVFSAASAHRAPSPEILALVNAAYAEAVAHSRIVPDHGRYRRVWTDHSDELELPLWPIAATANDLLMSAAVEQLRECPSESCSWLFLDQSRNQSRRWCDMKTCGNRAKARRHYERANG